MNMLCLTAIVNMSVLVSGQEETYAEAHRRTTSTGCPMVVMVSASWCPACRAMEKEVLPKVRKKGFFKRVAFARVDLDKEQKLGQRLTGGGPIPQLIMFRRNGHGWLRRRLIGRQSASVVQAFIDEGLERDRRARRATRQPNVSSTTGSGPAGGAPPVSRSRQGG